jgi:hypothetical protein
MSQEAVVVHASLELHPVQHRLCLAAFQHASRQPDALSRTTAARTDNGTLRSSCGGRRVRPEVDHDLRQHPPFSTVFLIHISPPLRPHAAWKFGLASLRRLVVGEWPRYSPQQ